MTARWPAALVLENGKVFRGEGFGARIESIGEVVFNTSITGYQEIVSDPSYCGQIVCQHTPHFGPSSRWSHFNNDSRLTRSPDPPAPAATAGSSGRGPWRS